MAESKATSTGVEAPRITYRCPNCQQVDGHSTGCPSAPTVDSEAAVGRLEEKKDSE